MSASREKKERQDVAAQGLTQRQLKEAQEAQAAKRKSVGYWILGGIVTVLAVALLVWNSGFFQRRAVAATVGDVKLTLGEMQYYYGLVRNNELDQQRMYAQWGISILADPYAMYDFNSAEGDSQLYNKETKQTYAEHFRENTLKAATDAVAISAAAKADNFTLSADGKANLQKSLTELKAEVKKNGWPSFGAFLGRAYGKYLTEGTFTACQERGTLAGEYAAHKKDALTYTTDQLKEYEEKNPATLKSYDYRYAMISGAPETKKDADGKTIPATDEEKEAAKKAAQEKADAIVKAVQAAGADEKQDVFNALVKETLGASSSYANPENNLHTKVLGGNLSQDGAYYFDWLSDAARKPGDVGAIAAGSDQDLVLFLGAELDDTATVDVRHILIKAENPKDDPATTDKDESQGAPTQEALDAAKAKAQKILDDFNALPEAERTAETFGKLAKEYSEDPGSKDKGGLYRYVVKGSMVPEFDAWLFEAGRKAGDTGLTANVAEGSSYYGYHVMYFDGLNGPKWHDLAENALRNDDMTKWNEETLKPYTAAWTDAGSAAVGK